MARGDGTKMSMDEFVAQLSPEELVRGQIKAKDGTFRGAPPMWVPRAFHRACIAELMRRGKRLWQENYLSAIETMTAIATGAGGASPGERLKAAQFVIERLEGKIPERLIVTDEQPWALVLDDIVADVSDEQVERGRKVLASAEAVRQDIVDPRDPVVEAELVDEEPTPVRRSPRRRRASK